MVDSDRSQVSGFIAGLIPQSFQIILIFNFIANFRLSFRNSVCSEIFGSNYSTVLSTGNYLKFGSISAALLPGQILSSTFQVDSSINRFFTFASMVVPSNDFFIGNDSPTEYQLFDRAGNLQLSSISLKANQIWDAGSEVYDPAAAVFLAIGNNNLRTPQNSVVGFNFAELSGFNGLTTAPGYIFNSG